jgi:DNA-directed RNA polymerase sigma subunit (sigma70/sigma32)
MARRTLNEIAEPVDAIAGPVALAHQRLLEQEVRRAVDELDARSKTLVCLGFGLSGGYTYTLTEIARILQRDEHYVH